MRLNVSAKDKHNHLYCQIGYSLATATAILNATAIVTAKATAKVRARVTATVIVTTKNDRHR
jgi:hypothetical protein